MYLDTRAVRGFKQRSRLCPAVGLTRSGGQPAHSVPPRSGGRAPFINYKDDDFYKLRCTSTSALPEYLAGAQRITLL